MTQIYCYKDWVVEKFGQGRDGDRNRKKYFANVPPKNNGFNYPGRLHRADKEQRKFNITPGYVICWIGILILQGAHFGSHTRAGSKLWRQGPYGVDIPYIQNDMTGNAFYFMRQFIRFTDKSIRKVSWFYPLSKVLYTLVSCSNHIISAFVSSRCRYHLCIITSVSHPRTYHHDAATIFVSSCRRYPYLRNYIISASSTAVLYHINPTHHCVVSYRPPNHCHMVSYWPPIPPFRII